ncbi:protein of unknown function [Salinibacterium xinjiangense]|uniref:DUF4062 domain-containing protein n=1 Tax=Salinibacterium xinjiangense TaxID=386302 RepID=A0A2C8ZWB7_9MICO|nr:DUF4062 domain-containing protein [Salinibacterium xinjiangense]SOE70146.1 protein of unknown function [Salinibacterium xinjiangense]
MAAPTVFVSSTFYDLRYARESLKRFIEQFGYISVLSEAGAVYYNPKTTAAESCLQEVSNANILILLIGGRYGMALPGSSESVTNAEYQRAVKDKVPVFALVEQSTLSDYAVYQANLGSPEALAKMKFPNADSVKIFEFIDSVRTQTENNALVPFRTISDIENYLRAQWAGMMHDHLSSNSREAQVVDTLAVLTSVNTRVELIASQILRSVGTQMDRVYVNLLQAMIGNSVIGDFQYFGGSPTPGQVLRWPTVEECAMAQGKVIGEYGGPEDTETQYIISSSGAVTNARRRQMTSTYEQLRDELGEILELSGLKLDDVLEYEKSTTSIYAT